MKSDLYDKINIYNLEVFANHGVLPEENSLGQKFIISASLYTDTRAAAGSDDLNLSVNYADVCSYINDFMKQNTFSLIETVANRLAAAILVNYNAIKAVDIEIKKPWAPVGLPVDTVSVSLSRQWHTAYLSAGSNIGNKEAYINNAIESMKNCPEIKVEKVSSLITTAPYGYKEQDDFLNCAMKISTIFSPNQLLDYIHSLENDAKRERIIHWGPRTLDLDILFYDNLIINDDRLTIPHPEIEKRDFVLRPLNEIEPNLLHPVSGSSINCLFNSLNN